MGNICSGDPSTTVAASSPPAAQPSAVVPKKAEASQPTPVSLPQAPPKDDTSKKLKEVEQLRSEVEKLLRDYHAKKGTLSKQFVEEAFAHIQKNEKEEAAKSLQRRSVVDKAFKFSEMTVEEIGRKDTQHRSVKQPTDMDLDRMLEDYKSFKKTLDDLMSKVTDAVPDTSKDVRYEVVFLELILQEDAISAYINKLHVFFTGSNAGSPTFLSFILEKMKAAFIAEHAQLQSLSREKRAQELLVESCNLIVNARIELKGLLKRMLEGSTIHPSVQEDLQMKASQLLIDYVTQSFITRIDLASIMADENVERAADATAAALALVNVAERAGKAVLSESASFEGIQAKAIGMFCRPKAAADRNHVISGTVRIVDLNTRTAQQLLNDGKLPPLSVEVDRSYVKAREDYEEESIDLDMFQPPPDDIDMPDE